MLLQDLVSSEMHWFVIVMEALWLLQQQLPEDPGQFVSQVVGVGHAEGRGRLVRSMSVQLLWQQQY